MFSHSAVLVLAVVATACQGIEVIESVFKGEKYEGEASRLENLPYSSSHIAAAFGSDGGDLQARKVPDEEGRNFPYSGLMQQLGEALNNLVSAHLGQGGRQGEGRDLDLQEEGKQVRKKTYISLPFNVRYSASLHLSPAKHPGSHTHPSPPATRNRSTSRKKHANSREREKKKSKRQRESYSTDLYSPIQKRFITSSSTVAAAHLAFYPKSTPPKIHATDLR